MVNITINNKKIQVPEGTTILNAAKQAGIDIPVLCYHPDLDIKANCRICVVEVEGARTLQTACSTRVWEGMAVRTNTPKVRQARKIIVELILAGHEMDCTYCKRNNRCDLQKIAADLGIRENPFRHVERDLERDTSGPSLERNPNKCIKCGRCIQMCGKVQGLSLLDYVGRSDEVEIKPAFGKYLTDIACVACGQCAVVCPVAAITEKEDIDRVWEAINDPDKVVIVQTAPAVRVALGEEFGFEPGKVVTGKMVAALRALGFDKVFDTDFTADLTIIEEGNELLQRLSNGGVLPMLTSCSPGWINFIEQYYPELLPHVSTCKSPQQMFGALVKTYWAEKMGVDPSKIYSVSIMPCTAKKFEASRPEMNDSGYRDVDLVLTTREVGRLFRMAGIDFSRLAPSNFDSWMGAYTGAAVIFGATGGVMEAALRTVYEVVTGKTLEDVNFTFARGMEGIKEAEIDLDGTVVKVAIGHGLANARKLMEQVRAGESPYHFIEIMACPGGCIGGGGQPITKSNAKRAERIQAIYEEDAGLPLRKSHDNPEVKAIYADFLTEPLGDKSHELLHTHYTPKNKKFL